ncbi:glycosyltransferase family 4 protein [Brunnivagina elsteri]|uniref:Glycosyltransferase n=1 Tax=Brunnivagina elsteri CCALA 953 TaxID=987040 RepID=A0A2A2TPD1_9CYAN|nr:glycosyltransferase [Calothrix elsteri]PAX60285.1 glycosyltransferase [Calothrix elsteri CCALA 953]
MPKELRVLYAVGPENAIESYNCWIKGEDVSSQVSITYSSQFYEACRKVNAKGYVIAQARKKQIVKDKQFIVEHRPVSLANAKGIFYHLQQILYGLNLLISSYKFQANVAVIDSGTTYWFLLLLFRGLGIEIIPSLHCTLWRKYGKQTLGEKIILKLSQTIFSSSSKAITVVSNEIAEQISQLTKGHHPKVFAFLPSFNPVDFADIIQPQDTKSNLFRVLYIGRIESNKGVFDLLEIAKRFADEGRKHIIFDICGDGLALETLHLAVKNLGIESTFLCHGYCYKPKIKEMLNRSHVLIVPTKSQFVEGFNRVIAESILSGRPVISSAVCPAIFYVRDGVFEVPPDDVEAYGNALINLSEDYQLYEQKRLACVKLQEQFYDINNSWGTALKSIFLEIQKEQEIKILKAGSAFE